MIEPANIAELVGIIGAIVMLCIVVALAMWPGIRPLIGRKHAWFWIGTIVMTAYAGTKPPIPPGPSIEGIAMKIDRVWSHKVQCSWEFEGEPELEGKRVRVRVHNAKMNGWLDVFEGDADTDRSCTFSGCYIVDDTEVQVVVENAVMMASVSLEVAR